MMQLLGFVLKQAFSRYLTYRGMIESAEFDFTQAFLGQLADQENDEIGRAHFYAGLWGWICLPKV
jgi:hypothetical protein